MDRGAVEGPFQTPRVFLVLTCLFPVVSQQRTSAETELDRDIGSIGAIALGTGTMIAAGIFVLSGLTVSNIGARASHTGG